METCKGQEKTNAKPNEGRLRPAIVPSARWPGKTKWVALGNSRQSGCCKQGLLTRWNKFSYCWRVYGNSLATFTPVWAGLSVTNDHESDAQA